MPVPPTRARRSRPTPAVDSAPLTGIASRQTYLLTFSVKGKARFVGHLDKTEIFRRVVRRAGGRLALSAGMRPKALLTLALPLAVGMEGERELCEFALAEEPPTDYAERLQRALPPGLGMVALERYAAARPAAARVVAGLYEVEVETAPPGASQAEAAGLGAALSEAADRFRSAPSLPVEDRRGDKIRILDVKAYVDACGRRASGGSDLHPPLQGEDDPSRLGEGGEGRGGAARAGGPGVDHQEEHAHHGGAAMKLLLISRDGPETRVALLDAGRIYEFYTERPGRLSRVGNIYKGRVENVLAGMDAAFVDMGLERNGYLSVDEVAGVNPGGGRPQKKITQLLRSGEQVLVQVIREGMGGKGPRLTTQLSLAGRYVVYMPGGSHSGASRRLEEAERERLRGLCRVLLPEDGGLIARTAAEGASEDALVRDLRFLQRVWAGVARRAAAAQAPCLVYTEAELALRAVRDLSGPDVEKVIVDDEHLYRRLVNYLRAVAPRLASRVELYGEAEPLFERYGLEGEARKALGRRVELPSGGYLVIDPTEAMTVDRCQHGPLRRQAPSRRHHPQDQPGGLPRDRPSAASTRHRGHHRHRLHRHGFGGKPGGRAGGVAGRTGRRPHQDVRRSPLAPRSGGDDETERDSGAARDHDQPMPHLPRRGAGALRGVGPAGCRAPAAESRAPGGDPGSEGGGASPYADVAQSGQSLASAESGDQQRPFRHPLRGGGERAARPRRAGSRLRGRRGPRRPTRPAKGGPGGHAGPKASGIDDPPNTGGATPFPRRLAEGVPKRRRCGPEMLYCHACGRLRAAPSICLSTS